MLVLVRRSQFGVRRQIALTINLTPNLNPFRPLSALCCRSKFCSPARIFPRNALLADKSSSCSAREAINPIQSWIVGVTAKGAAIQRTTRCRVAGRRYFAESPLDGLKPGSRGGSRSPSGDMSHEPHPSAKTCGRQSRRNEADAPNPCH